MFTKKVRFDFKYYFDYFENLFNTCIQNENTPINGLVIYNNNSLVLFQYEFIYNKYYLTTKKGRWKGYPFRSFADGGFSGGYSDHFPVYVYVIKQVEN